MKILPRAMYSAQALEMLSDTHNLLPMISLITDGAVEDERRICNDVKGRRSNTKTIFPRIHTFGIDSIQSRLQKLITRASSIVFANITFDSIAELDNAEVYPINIPDLSSESPLIISGRYSGKFPEVCKARGIIADMTGYEMDLKVHKAKAIPLEKILALQQIPMCTSQAWFLEDKELEKKIAKMSIHNGIVSEFTSMALFVTETLNKEAELVAKQEYLSRTMGKVREQWARFFRTTYLLNN